MVLVLQLSFVCMSGLVLLVKLLLSERWWKKIDRFAYCRAFSWRFLFHFDLFLDAVLTGQELCSEIFAI